MKVLKNSNDIIYVNSCYDDRCNDSDCDDDFCHNYGGSNCPDDVCGFDSPNGTCRCDHDTYW